MPGASSNVWLRIGFPKCMCLAAQLLSSFADSGPVQAAARGDSYSEHKCGAVPHFEDANVLLALSRGSHDSVKAKTARGEHCVVPGSFSLPLSQCAIRGNGHGIEVNAKGMHWHKTGQASHWRAQHTPRCFELAFTNTMCCACRRSPSW